MAESQAALKSKYAVLFHHLDERQRRLVVVAADAERLNKGVRSFCIIFYPVNCSYVPSTAS